MNYGAYLTPEKLIVIELPHRHPESACDHREMKSAKADLLALNLRSYTDLGGQKMEHRWTLERAIEVLIKQSK